MKRVVHGSLVEWYAPWRWRCLLLAGCLLALPSAAGPHAAVAAAPAGAGPISLVVDLDRAAQGIVQVHQRIPVSAGALTLRYPQWVPGENLPSGPIDNVAGLRIEAAGQRLRWRRDAVDMYALHVRIPPGVTQVDLAFQYLAPARAGDLAGTSPGATRAWAVLEFNQLLFYPAGHPVRSLQVAASVNLPAGWQFASALPVAGRSGNRVRFGAVDLGTLVDSPVQAGAHFRRIDLTSGAMAPVHLDIVADNATQLDVAAARVQALRAVVREAVALLGPPHYPHYDFLLTRSVAAGGFGLEHLASSDDRFPPAFLGATDTDLRTLRVLPHELVHSWNGKFRRPAGMLTADFNTPMHDQLQWVYEGLTDYWACLLSTRAGLWSERDYRDWLAAVSAQMAHRHGRRWRSLQDTADAAARDQDDAAGWANWRRGTDFYAEGQLLWLDVDASIRKLSGNRRSLDDFARLFFAAPPNGAAVQAYTFDDIVALLDQVQPNDWRQFLRQRLDQLGADLPEQGLAQSGWRLLYSPTPSAYAEALRARGDDPGVTYALGMQVGGSGLVRDVAWDGPAFQAGLAPGMRIRSVNGTSWSASVLREAITGVQSPAAGGDVASGAAHAMTLQVADRDHVFNATLHYHGGLRYPHLQRVPGQPDFLHDSIGARAAMPATAAAATPAPATRTR